MPLTVETLVTGQLSANCYLVFEDTSAQATIIDPGDDADYIQSYLRDLSLTPEQIILTHGHFDHCLAAFEIQQAYQIPVIMHHADEFLLNDLPQSANHFVGISAAIPPQITQRLMQEKTFSMAGLQWKIMHTPGHTPGSITLVNTKFATAFVGDLIFAGGGVGRFDFKYSSEIDLVRSVKEVLSLPPATKIYPGHGPATTINAEKALHHR